MVRNQFLELFPAHIFELLKENYCQYPKQVLKSKVLSSVIVIVVAIFFKLPKVELFLNLFKGTTLK